MSVIRKMLKQKAVLWALQETLPSGQLVWAPPVAMAVRWETVFGENDEVMARRHLSDLVRFKVMVYTDRDVKVGDHLMLGPLRNNVPPVPFGEQTWEVDGFESTPNFKAKEFLRKAYMLPGPLVLAALHGRGVESITYRVTVSTSITAGGVLARVISDIAVPVVVWTGSDANDDEPARKISADVLSVNRYCDVPKVLLLPTREPGLDDVIIDAVGNHWNVIDWQESTIRSWWRITVKRGSV